MARRYAASRFSSLFISLLAIAFGLVALAVLYQAVKTSTEGRSQARTGENILKQWEFNGKTVEGWVGRPHTTSVANGSLRMVIRKTKSVPDILQKTANISLPQGNKYLKLLISVGSDGKRSALPGSQVFAAPIEGFGNYSAPGESAPQGGGGGPTVVSGGEIVNDPEFVRSVQSNVVCTQDVNQCPDGSYVGRIGPSCIFAPCPSVPKPSIGQPVSPLYTVRAAVYYKLTSSKRWEKPLEFDVVADGSYREYLARFPEIATTTVERIRIAFPSGLRVGHVVLIDWIRLVGTIPPSPPSTGTPYTCGGFTGALCPSGYQCNVPYPASGGTCVPVDSRTPTPINTPYISPTPPPTYYPSPTSIVCKTGINSFGVSAPCDPSYTTATYVTYICMDGYRGTLGDGKTCQSVDMLNVQAQKICSGRSNCQPTGYITPTPYPTYYTTPYPVLSPSPLDPKGVVNPMSVNLEIRRGNILKALEVTLPPGYGYEFKGYPTAYGSGIDWYPQAGGNSGENNQNAVSSVNIRVRPDVPVGSYTGEAIIYYGKINPDRPVDDYSIKIPVTVTVGYQIR